MAQKTNPKVICLRLLAFGWIKWYVDWILGVRACALNIKFPSGSKMHVNPFNMFSNQTNTHYHNSMNIEALNVEQVYTTNTCSHISCSQSNTLHLVVYCMHSIYNTCIQRAQCTIVQVVLYAVNYQNAIKERVHCQI